MKKKDLININAREVIPTAFLKKSVSRDTFETIVLPLFIKAYEEKDEYLGYAPSQRNYACAYRHKIASDAYLSALSMFYDQPKPEDDYDLEEAFGDALYDLHVYAYRLERYSDEDIDRCYGSEEYQTEVC